MGILRCFACMGFHNNRYTAIHSRLKVRERYINSFLFALRLCVSVLFYWRRVGGNRQGIVSIMMGGGDGGLHCIMYCAYSPLAMINDSVFHQVKCYF